MVRVFIVDRGKPREVTVNRLRPTVVKRLALSAFKTDSVKRDVALTAHQRARLK